MSCLTCVTTQIYIYVDNLSKVFSNNSLLMRYTTKYNRFTGYIGCWHSCGSWDDAKGGWRTILQALGWYGQNTVLWYLSIMDGFLLQKVQMCSYVQLGFALSCLWLAILSITKPYWMWEGTRWCGYSGYWMICSPSTVWWSMGQAKVKFAVSCSGFPWKG